MAHSQEAFTIAAVYNAYFSIKNKSQPTVMGKGVIDI